LLAAHATTCDDRRPFFVHQEPMFVSQSLQPAGVM
jgi:hypothetical protein